ncbi:histone deacetylase family protein [Mariniblastus fucicola]|uniref:Histone deacetylase-like amidohydrolase n=1 Tax=Mariniblastus fucicola TaxID=980251 RepID=A0A5B9PA96_9BACT|nr:histone deacetylase [Mariniblastus fucicola]QEG23184.1 Histone deacetylase-like amidohydrolase [Mariniblastus fucicola]
MKLFYSDVFELPLPGGHRFPMSKYTLLRERIAERLVGRGAELVLPPAATDRQILLVHSREYLDRVKYGGLSQLEQRRIGFPWSLKMVERSRRSTGATIAAAKAALSDGVAFNLAGGTHHAFADRGQGYCVFNDACVAARVLQSEGLIERAMVVDCDVHQGNGTASIVDGDDSIFTFSIQCESNFPFRKTNGDLDINLPVGTGDERYLTAISQGVQQALTEFEPDIVFYLAGADPYEGDRLGKLAVSKSGLRRRDEWLFRRCFDAKLPVAVSMAGGYANDVGDIVDIHFATVESALDRKLRHSDRPSSSTSTK